MLYVSDPTPEDVRASVRADALLMEGDRRWYETHFKRLMRWFAPLWRMK